MGEKERRSRKLPGTHGWKVITRAGSAVIDATIIYLIVKPFTRNIYLTAVMYLIYYTLMDRINSATLGKRIFRIQVWGRVNDVTVIGRAVIKTVIIMATMFNRMDGYEIPRLVEILTIPIMILYGIGVLVIFYMGTDKLPHDLILGTNVSNRGRYIGNESSKIMNNVSDKFNLSKEKDKRAKNKEQEVEEYSKLYINM